MVFSASPNHTITSHFRTVANERALRPLATPWQQEQQQQTSNLCIFTACHSMCRT